MFYLGYPQCLCRVTRRGHLVLHVLGSEHGPQLVQYMVESLHPIEYSQLNYRRFGDNFPVFNSVFFYYTFHTDWRKRSWFFVLCAVSLEAHGLGLGHSCRRRRAEEMQVSRSSGANGPRSGVLCCVHDEMYRHTPFRKYWYIDGRTLPFPSESARHLV